MFKRRKKILRVALTSTVLLGLGSGVMWTSAANAQLIGPCPSPLMPPPCIIFDYKRLAELSQEHAQQVQRLQEMVKQVQETKATAESLGGAVNSVQSMVSAAGNIAPGEGSSLTTITTSNFRGTVDNFASALYDNPGGGIDAESATAEARRRELIAANTDGIAMSMAIRADLENSHKRMVCLGKVAQSSQDARGDWAVNTQVKIEVLRQQTQRDQLLTTVLQSSSVGKVMGSTSGQGEEVSTGTVNAPPPLPPRNPAWEKRDTLRKIATIIQTLAAARILIDGIDNVRRDGKSVIDRYQNVETRREQALNNFRQRAAQWSGGSANIVVDTTVAELNRIDSQMAALRSQPIGSLSGAFQERNIDVNAMVQNDVDPRQFIWTWADPMKNRITLDMANTLLRGRLDNLIDGDRENDEYREMVIALNDARLEEAWMRTYAQEAGNSINVVNAIADEESVSLGYKMDKASVDKNLAELVAQANQLAQEIQQSGDPAATQQAANLLNQINSTVNRN